MGDRTMRWVWTIYKLIFPDRHEYVGQTRRGVNVRLRGHKNDRLKDGRLTEVARRLRAGQTPEVIVLSTRDNASDADCAELAAQAQIRPDLRINGWQVVPRRNTPFPPVDGKYECVWCLRMVPTREMSVDRNRSRGYGSKCKECVRCYWRLCQPLKPAVAYQVARDLCVKHLWDLSRQPVRNRVLKKMGLTQPQMTT